MSRPSDITRGNSPVDGRVAVLLIVLTFLWGFNQVAIKLSNEGFDPLFSVALLYQAIVVVAVSYMVWFWLMRHYMGSSLSSFVLLTPAFGVLSGGLILGEPLTGRIFAALALIMAGLFIVNRPARRAHPG